MHERNTRRYWFRHWNHKTKIKVLLKLLQEGCACEQILTPVARPWAQSLDWWKLHLHQCGKRWLCHMGNDTWNLTHSLKVYTTHTNEASTGGSSRCNRWRICWSTEMLRSCGPTHKHKWFILLVSADSLECKFNELTETLGSELYYCRPSTQILFHWMK